MRVSSSLRGATRRRTTRSAACLLLAGAVSAAGMLPARAAPAAASAFGASVQVNGTDVVSPTPTATVAVPTGDDSDTVVDLPVSPVVVSGTLTATAAVHATADLASGLTVVEQSLDGPYDATALAQVEGLGVVYDVAGAGIPLLSAALVRAEAVAVCTATPSYAATSEIVDLRIADTPVPVNAPVQDLIDAITDALETTGLEVVVDVDRDVVTEVAGGGIAVDALVVTVLAAAGDIPLATVRIAHAEVTAAACVPDAECSDAADNDGDAVIDAADPGCHTDGDAGNDATYDPGDDDERNAPECSDTADNDGDAVIDAADPGCHTDGDAGNALTYDPNDDSEADAAALAAARDLPRTGAGSTAALIGVGALGLAAIARALRRRFALA